MPAKRTTETSQAMTRAGSSAAGAPDKQEAPDKPEYRVEALAKGLRILTLFDEQRPCWRVTDLAAAAGLPLPTVYRVVMTLTAEGYLDHLPNGDYRPGVKTLTLGTAALRSLDLVGVATPKLQRLGEATGETVNMAVLTGDRVLYLVRLRNSDLVTANIQVGSTLPAVTTSIGKLLLAHLNDDELRRHITRNPLPHSTHRTPRPPSTNCARSSSRSANRAGRCRTRSWRTAGARSPGRSSVPTAAWSPALTWPSRLATGPRSGSCASCARPC